MISQQSDIDIIKSHLQSASIVTLERINILAVTWNVNSKVEEAQNLSEIFDCYYNQLSVSLPDIIVVGIQEIVELTATNVVSSQFTGPFVDIIDSSSLILQYLGNTAERAHRWKENILASLNSTSFQQKYGHHDESTSTRYVTMASCHMVGLWIGAFTTSSIMKGPTLRFSCMKIVIKVS